MERLVAVLPEDTDKEDALDVKSLDEERDRIINLVQDRCKINKHVLWRTSKVIRSFTMGKIKSEESSMSDLHCEAAKMKRNFYLFALILCKYFCTSQSWTQIPIPTDSCMMGVWVCE